jgi:hypothetical protein
MATATLSHQPLNQAQILLMQAFSRVQSEQENEELQQVLHNYYRKRVDAHVKTVSFTDEQIDEILNTHLRTPYK